MVWVNRREVIAFWKSWSGKVEKILKLPQNAYWTTHYAQNEYDVNIVKYTQKAQMW